MDERQVEIRVWSCFFCGLSGWIECGVIGGYTIDVQHESGLVHTTINPHCGNNTPWILEGFEGCAREKPIAFPESLYPSGLGGS